MSGWGSDSDSDDDLDGLLHAEPAAEPARSSPTRSTPSPTRGGTIACASPPAVARSLCRCCSVLARQAR